MVMQIHEPSSACANRINSTLKPGKVVNRWPPAISGQRQQEQPQDCQAAEKRQ